MKFRKNPDDEPTEKINYPLDQRIEYIANYIPKYQNQLRALAKEVKELQETLMKKING